jgi:hypothetical protein
MNERRQAMLALRSELAELLAPTPAETAARDLVARADRYLARHFISAIEEREWAESIQRDREKWLAEFAPTKTAPRPQRPAQRPSSSQALNPAQGNANAWRRSR